VRHRESRGCEYGCLLSSCKPAKSATTQFDVGRRTLRIRQIILEHLTNPAYHPRRLILHRRRHHTDSVLSLSCGLDRFLNLRGVGVAQDPESFTTKQSVSTTRQPKHVPYRKSGASPPSPGDSRVACGGGIYTRKTLNPSRQPWDGCHTTP
jgi:hypothetical protein